MKPIEEMSFEEAMRELEVIVNKLDSGDVPIEESVALYERGEKLKIHCQARLEKANLLVEKIDAKKGKVSAKPADDLTS